jgi:hypothetical protein
VAIQNLKAMNEENTELEQAMGSKRRASQQALQNIPSATTGHKIIECTGEVLTTIFNLIFGMTGVTFS